MAVEHIALRLVGFPEKYVRDKWDESHIAMFVTVYKQTNEGAAKPVWPFPPIKYRILDKPKAGKRFELVDGFHRVFAAAKLKLSTIPGEPYTPKDEAHAYLEQLGSNSEHGKLIDLDKRDRAIFDCAKLGVPQATIAKRLHLSEASVSRIITGRQRGTGAKVAKARGKGKGRAKKGTRFTAKGFFEGVAAFVQEYNTHAQAVQIFAKDHLSGDADAVGKAFETLSRAVETIFAKE